MHIPISVCRFSVIFLRYLFPCDLSFAFCDFDRVVCLIISTAVTHHTWTLISQANFQQCMFDRWHIHHSIMTNAMWQRFDQSAKRLIVGHITNQTAQVARTLTVQQRHAVKPAITVQLSLQYFTHTYMHPFKGTTRVSRYQNGKTNLDFTKARDSEWQWHQLGHMQVCSSLQTDTHASTSPLSLLQARCPSCCPTNSVKALKAKH